jgi:anti-sigma B factor antagonist
MRLFRRENGPTTGIGAAPSGEIDVQVVPGGKDSTIEVGGRVTVDSSPRLRAVLHEQIRAGTSRVLAIDFSRVSRCDTAGIATLLEAARVAQAHRVRLRMVGLQAEVRVLAEVTEMDAVFRAFGSEVVFT